MRRGEERRGEERRGEERRGEERRGEERRGEERRGEERRGEEKGERRYRNILLYLSVNSIADMFDIWMHRFIRSKRKRNSLNLLKL